MDADIWRGKGETWIVMQQCNAMISEMIKAQGHWEKANEQLIRQEVCHIVLLKGVYSVLREMEKVCWNLNKYKKMYKGKEAHLRAEWKTGHAGIRYMEESIWAHLSR